MEKDKKEINPKYDKLKLIVGCICIIVGLLMTTAFISYFFNWANDESQLNGLFDKNIDAENALGSLGNSLGNFFIGNGIGIIALTLPIFILFIGCRIAFNWKIISLKSYFIHASFWAFFTPLLLATFSFLSLPYYGVMGFEIIDFLQSFISIIGIVLLLALLFFIYLIIHINNPQQLLQNNFFTTLKSRLNKTSTKVSETLQQTETKQTVPVEEIKQEIPITNIKSNDLHSENEQITSTSYPEEDTFFEVIETNPTHLTAEEEPIYLDELLTQIPLTTEVNTTPTTAAENIDKTLEIENTTKEIQIEIEQPIQEEVEEEETLAEQIVSKSGLYDPRLDLPNYQFPKLEFLRQFENEEIQIDQEELEANKNTIVETLSHYKIGISKIKATVGPTITLYEIVPEAGIRISKIKNLEDDIALSLSALGIRIIAPIPGRGTIGIEVPNKNPRVVSMRSVVSSDKFQKSGSMALPIVFGKTISNESFVADLAKMPHLLMAGATGQGKSVGLNAVISSLLYKKHPAELKFVLVDPKKVELTLYNKIERHYLAKLPDSEEAIITDNTKVINTLNSLCIEMDNRYELLKNAMVRNIIEYNEKFIQRKLNPNDGHQFLPYIVLIIDEFADLIMTAGKEVETPVARLAQLARAIGIHLIVATQRPSVNVITGIIKANFPARIAFRVTSKIDSRTILDTGGADQLVGRGDMLFSNGNDLIRLQCAFVDTPEVELICDFIGGQKAYPDALHLPEYIGDQVEELDVDLSQRDKMFDEAARLIVTAQQGSASLLQRKLKLGYNRAGRIIDQLESAGIVGPFEGSKARQVLINDLNSLEQLLNNLNNQI